MNINYVCIQCKKSFLAPKSQHRKYCSQRCFMIRQNKLTPEMHYSLISKLTFSLTKEIINYLDGLLLGDGNIQKPTDRQTTRFRQTASKNHLDYLYEIKSKLKSYGIDSKLTPYDRFDKRTNKIYSGGLLQTKCYVTMLDIRKRWYKDIKFIPQDIELSRNVLRDWYIGDGYHRVDQNSIQLSTDAFSEEDINLLCSRLKNLGYSPKTSQKRVYLYIGEQVNRFIGDIGKLPESFKYKEGSISL